ncbi:hypothetical protein [Sphingomonas sp. C3-2]|uniref:hypothetical protein n=1 Tax=Sphingomonas sp. C3-2 TaxID=3062169 RepID=UPI00294ADE83|nr:hypothetical protein [Sphingomonas sp. C3-2]WOK35990.1 hypothetical protein QYC26_13405 [Sphingomonas sp. C3-2]
MRQDAKSLLERLSRRDFKYHEFADPFADMELWPMFEALLTDERVTGERAPTLRAAEVQVRSRANRAERAPERPAATGAGLFSKYAEKPQQPDRSGGTNMRKYLDRLSGKN